MCGSSCALGNNFKHEKRRLNILESTFVTKIAEKMSAANLLEPYKTEWDMHLGKTSPRQSTVFEKMYKQNKKVAMQVPHCDTMCEEPGGRMRSQPIEQFSRGKGCPWFGGCGNSHGQVTVPLFVSVRQCDQVVLQQRINSGKSQCGLIDKAPHS